MLGSIFKTFQRDRRAATAMIMAFMIVPLILFCGAAVDFSRVSSARAQLQAAVDAAAAAGVGTYKNDINPATFDGYTNAGVVATNTFKSSIANLTAYSAVGNPVASASCTGGSTAICGKGGGTSCANNYTYCVTVTASATLNNSLLGAWIPHDTLRVSGSAATNPPSNCASNTPPTCIYNSSLSFITPYGPGGNYIVSSSHLAGTGNPVYSTTANNPGGGAVDFNVFLNGNNNALPGPGSHVPPSQNTKSDPCASSSYYFSNGQILQPGGTIYDVYGNGVSCPTSGKCTLPGGTYCGSLTIGGGVTLTLTSTLSNPAVYIEDGNLLVSPASIVTETNPSNIASGYVPIYFGGNTTGSLVLEQETQIDPSQIHSGTIEYISTFNSVNQQSNGTQTELNAGVCEDAAAYCTSGAVGAPAIYYSNAGTVTYNDTYITFITVLAGVETAWSETEVLATEFTDNSGNLIGQPTTETVSYSGSYPDTNANLMSSSTSSSSYSPSTVTPSSTFTCMSPQNQLYYNTTTGTGSGANPNLGYSYASPNISGDGLLAETINVCGQGSDLASNGGSGTGNIVGPSSGSSNPVLIN